MHIIRWINYKPSTIHNNQYNIFLGIGIGKDEHNIVGTNTYTRIWLRHRFTTYSNNCLNMYVYMYSIVYGGSNIYLQQVLICDFIDHHYVECIVHSCSSKEKGGSYRVFWGKMSIDYIGNGIVDMYTK